MYRWYERSVLCYAFLADVEPSGTNTFDAQDFESNLDANLVRSRYWTRGWTLQELIAPLHVTFLDSRWRTLGTKRSLTSAISEITHIRHEHLVQPSRCNIATKMTLAKGRKTTKEEDMAYCLLGLFDVSMPLLYGEGWQKAFTRLQEEIVKASDDESFLAHNLNIRTLLATSPDDFLPCETSIVDADRPDDSLTNKGLSISSVLWRKTAYKYYYLPPNCKSTRQESPATSANNFIALRLERREERGDCNVYITKGLNWTFLAGQILQNIRFSRNKDTLKRLALRLLVRLGAASHPIAP